MRRGRPRALLAPATLLAGLAAVGPLGAVPSSRAETSRQADAYHLYSLAQQSLLVRDYASAVELMEKAASRDASPEMLLELARLRYSLSDLDRAADLAQRAVAADASLPGAHGLLGDIYLSRARAGSDPDANVARAVDQYRAALAADPADSEACRSLADLYYHTGRLEEAAALLRSFAASRPLDPAMSLLLGKVCVRTGLYAEAEEILGGIVQRAPGNLEAADALAALYEYQKKYDQAIALYTDLLKAGPPTAYLLDRIGSLHLQAGRQREAIRALEEGQRLDPSDGRGLLALAQAYDAAGETAAATAAYDRLIEREPGNLEARFHRARLEQRQGDPAASVRRLRGIIDLATGRGALTEREAAVLALTYSQIGIIEMEGRNYAAAATAFGKAVDSSDDPGPELYLLLGRANLEGGRTDEAQRVIVEASHRYPGDLEVSVFEGELLIVRGDFPSAHDFYQTLLRDRGGSPEAYARVSEALLRQKRFADAETILKEGTRRHPSDDTLLFARGAAMERLGRLGEAERYLVRAIRLNPKNAMALNYLGYMLADRGLRLRDSIAYVERALALDPKNAAYLDSLGWAQFKMSLYGPAEENLRSAALYDRADPTIREHLGDLLMSTGRADEAVREWEAALAQGHEEPDRVRGKIGKANAKPRSGP
jgi:tetratricopeptide (TPR) repeat protein